jgi:hypothetical protein
MCFTQCFPILDEYSYTFYISKWSWGKNKMTLRTIKLSVLFYSAITQLVHNTATKMSSELISVNNKK